MFYNNINPTLLEIGPFEIRYYGIIFVIGFIIAYFLIIYLSKQKKIELKKEDVADLIFYELIGILIGSRLLYVLIYNPLFYLKSPLSIFAIWLGGLSFHGGLIGAIIAGYIYCRKKKTSFLQLGDLVVIPLAIGLMLGRIGNFINGELVGRITDVPWAVKFKDYEGFRHPSQLYEASKNLIIFITLWGLKNKKLKRGTLFFTFIFMYSTLRFFIEFFRAPDTQIGFILGLTMGQILCVIMFFSAVVFLIYSKKQKLKK